MEITFDSSVDGRSAVYKVATLKRPNLKLQKFDQTSFYQRAASYGFGLWLSEISWAEELIPYLANIGQQQQLVNRQENKGYAVEEVYHTQVQRELSEQRSGS